MTGLNVTVCIYTDEELGRWLLAQIVKVCVWGVWKNRKPESGIGTGMGTGTGTGTGNSNGTETAM